jgi:peptidoglycan/xylan/chitin deacetylase (PgdA/CDA1 family)
MSHPKKHGRHRCKNHPKTIALGRCTACKSWICGECAELRTGRYFCKPDCVAPPAPAAPAEERPAQTRPAERNIPQFPALLVLAGVTVGLCGAAFGLWEMRRNRMLTEENEAFRTKRIELINHIKDGNHEISELSREADSLRRRPAAGDIKPRGKSAQSDRRQAAADTAAAVDGLPVSFDNGTTDKKLIALTFDGGSNGVAVGDILDTLKSRNVKATMFLTGEFIRAFPDAVRRIVADGHEVGNHTFSHPHLTSWAQDHTNATLPAVSEAFVCDQLRHTDSLFLALTGAHLAPLWRAPFGEKNRAICAWAQRCGYVHIGWRQGKTWRQGLDSNDWVPDEETPGFHTPEEVVDKILALAGDPPDGINGGIVLMHLGTERKDTHTQMYRMLGKLIDDLKAMGYAFVTTPEMLKESGVDISLLNHL